LNILFHKLKEVFLSVFPIVVIVLILNFTLTPLPLNMLIQFFIGAFLIIIGLSIFLVGVDLGITPLGNNVGSTISKSNKIWFVVVAGLILGFFISVAEPDLQILANQVGIVTNGQISSLSILVVVSVGIAVMLVIGLLRIVYNKRIHIMMAIIYGIICLIAILAQSPVFLAISFDASGATTGALTVPFILALAIGVSVLKKDAKASENDSFGLVGIASTGAILGVLIMGIFNKTELVSAGVVDEDVVAHGILAPFFEELPHLAFESFVAISPLIVIFVFFQFKYFHLDKRHFRRIIKGLLYTLIGLIIFLVGVNAGFLQVGTEIGFKIAQYDTKIFAVGVGLVLGVVTILAEPAVYVLTQQIEMVTSGSVKRKVVLVALCVGVGLAVALSILRIVVPSIQLWHYLVPGYIISIALTFFVPQLFVGIAFDSGGVASGPMTATFILAFAQGVASSVAGADVLKDAFGMIALVAMTPIITLQILGLLYKFRSKRKVEKK